MCGSYAVNISTFTNLNRTRSENEDEEMKTICALKLMICSSCYSFAVTLIASCLCRCQACCMLKWSDYRPLNDNDISFQSLVAHNKQFWFLWLARQRRAIGNVSGSESTGDEDEIITIISAHFAKCQCTVLSLPGWRFLLFLTLFQITISPVSLHYTFHNHSACSSINSQLLWSNRVRSLAAI